MTSVTEKEIKEQYLAWEAVLKDSQNGFKEFGDAVYRFDNSEFVFIGCGTSFYLSLSAAAIFQTVTGKQARAVPASDVFLFSDTIFSKNGNYLGIPISRSGETTETIWAARYLKEKLDIPTLALSCNADSKLVDFCDHKLIAAKAAEKSVVMTKSFTSMLLIIQLLSAIISKNKELLAELARLPVHGKSVIKNFENIAKNAAQNRDVDHLVFLGQGPYYGLASEAMLKMREMSLTFSEAYHSMEYRHGPISTLNENTLVVFLMSESSKTQEIKLLKEVKKLGAKTLVICENLPAAEKSSADYLVELESSLSDDARLVLYMPVIQMMGLYRALHKEINPDNPRHLTQVVVLD